MNVVNNFVNVFRSPNFYVPVIIICLLIVAGNLFKSPVQQVMKNVLFSIGGMEIDWWSVSHFLLYIYFGYQFPGYYAEFLIIGAAWEFFESVFCRDSFAKLIGCQHSDNIVCRNIDRIKGCDYWYGKIDDVAVNMVGFLFGMCLAKMNGKCVAKS